jgi:integrase
LSVFCANDAAQVIVGGARDAADINGQPVAKMLFRRLHGAEILEKNPARLVKQLPENDRSFHVITEAERKRYSLAAPPLLTDVFNLMLETGLRCGEVYRLKRGEVNLQGNYLQVTRGKTKSSIRRVHLSEKAKQILAG